MSENQPRYRVYSLDGLRKIVSADWIDAGSDEEAIAAVHASGICTKCEIWHGNRLVAKFDAERRSA